MRRNKTAAAGAICGVLCALCVLGYTQSVRGEAERARADGPTPWPATAAIRWRFAWRSAT